MYVRNSTVDLTQNFISFTPEHVSCPQGQELIIRTKEPEEKLSTFINPDAPEGYVYNIPMSLVVDLELKPLEGKTAKLTVQHAKEEDSNEMLNISVRDAFDAMQRDSMFGSRAKGTFLAIHKHKGGKTIGSFLKSMSRDRWMSYEGMSTGMLKIVENIYTRFSLELE